MDDPLDSCEEEIVLFRKTFFFKKEIMLTIIKIMTPTFFFILLFLYNTKICHVAKIINEKTNLKIQNICVLKLSKRNKEHTTKHYCFIYAVDNSTNIFKQTDEQIDIHESQLIFAIRSEINYCSHVLLLIE